MKRADISEQNAEIHQGKRDEGGNEKVDALAVKEAADSQRERDLNQAGKNSGGVSFEDCRND